MADLLIPDVPDDTVDCYRRKAELNGRTLEQELRDLLERNKVFTPEERVASSRSFLARFDKPAPSLTLDEIRDGLE